MKLTVLRPAMKSFAALLLLLFVCELRAIPGPPSAGGQPDILVGEWYYLEPGETGHSTLFFGRDGRFRGSYILKEGLTVSFAGRWTRRGDKIHYRYEWCSHPLPTKDGTDTIVEVSEKSLTTIEGGGPSKKVYRRITR